jgi:hypothetical protein
MRTYSLIMGCTQTSARDIPPNHIPIERLYDKENYTIAEPLPAVNIIVPPTPLYVKSALKKTYPDGRAGANTLPLRKPKSLPFNKAVNFDEQVLVKSRTPTPSKIWYEKASSTMPMRRHPRNDDDDHDYDYEEAPSVSSDEDEENDQQIDTETQMPKPRPPTPLRQSNQADSFYDQTEALWPVSTANRMLENDYLPVTAQQTYAAENQFASPINRIKVRRKLPTLGPPELLPVSPYQSAVQSSTIPSYRSPAQSSVVSTYRIPGQTAIVSPYQTSIRPPTSYRPPLTNSVLPSQTAYYPYTRPPLENVTQKKE